MWSEHTIDDVLGDAVIPDVFADYDLVESKRRIADDVAQILRSGADFHRPACPSASPTVHGQAARDLDVLATQALRRSDAAQHLSRLANSRRIDPDGALQFGCLLILAGCDEGAQFWWQFAAGAGNSTAAHCLHLLHLRRGELRDAEHWAGQAIDLAHGPDHLGGRHEVIRPRGQRTPPLALQAAVGHLGVEPDEDFGAIPQPDPTLADQLPELVHTL